MGLYVEQAFLASVNGGEMIGRAVVFADGGEMQVGRQELRVVDDGSWIAATCEGVEVSRHIETIV